MITSDLPWTEKYRPTKISEYVFADDDQKKIISGWAKNKKIPWAILFHGAPGVGKTTAATVLINELGVQVGDYISINCADETSVELRRL